MFGLTGIKAEKDFDEPTKRRVYGGARERISDACPAGVKKQLTMARKAAKSMGLRLEEYLALPAEKREF